MRKILIIEDDIKLIKYMKEYLNAYDYKTDIIDDFDNIKETLENLNYDLILLDINLPKFDGFYFLKLIRRNNKIPVIIVSSRDEEAEQIRGINLGADDYITKPFSMGILLAKINAVLRRIDNASPNIIKVKDVNLYCESMELKTQDKSLELSKNEFKLLKIFLSNYNKVISREELLEELWDEDEFVDDNTLTVNMTRLKKKLKAEEVNLIIETKRGIGYVLK